MAKKDAYKIHIRRLLSDLIGTLYLYQWSFDICWDCEQLDSEGQGTTVAQTDVLPRYFSAKICLGTVVRQMYDAGDYRKVCSTIVHELCHSITEALSVHAKSSVAPAAADLIQTVNEQTVQHLTNVVMGLIPEKMWQPA